MKKLFYILIAGVLLAGACAKEDETPAEKIIGTWELQYYYRDTIATVNFDTYEQNKRFTEQNTLEIRADTTCGISETTEDTYYTANYHANDTCFYLGKTCSYNIDGFYPTYTIYYSHSKFRYILKDNILITAVNDIYKKNGDWFPCIYYGYYLRK
jgi:hypothetical protein